MIHTINTIDIIDYINQHEENKQDVSNQLTLQTSPTQLRLCCFLYIFSSLIKVSSIVVLHPLSYCWYAHLCFIFCFFFSNQSYIGTHSRGDTAIPTRNGLFLCISWSDIYSCLSPTTRIIFLCSSSYQMQQGGSENNVKYHSRQWSSKKWCNPFDLGVWQGW